MGAVLARHYGGWVVQDQTATGRSMAMLRLASVAGTALSTAIGTVGSYHSLDQIQRLLNPKPLTASAHYEAVEGKVVRTPSQDLQRIREVLKPAVSELASVFGVSRQSIYNWINGESVALENVSKLHDLASAADVLAFQGIRVDSNLLKRKFHNGKSLMQVAKAGESAQSAALNLVQIIKREAIQRERMNARFANRMRANATSDFDLPHPNDKS